MNYYDEVDLKFSEEGDLVLGRPLLDENGEIVYNEYNNPVVDFATTENEEALKQDVSNRIKTNSPEWILHPLLGANLEDMIGEPNTRETGKMGAQNIKEALTRDRRVHENDISVKAVPTDHDEITFFVRIFARGMVSPLLMSIPFNFIHGVMLNARD